MHIAPLVVAFNPSAGKVSLYACGDAHLRSPTGDLANGIERKALAPLVQVVPRTVPAGIVALGAALTSDRPETTMKREGRNECIFKKQYDFDFSRKLRRERDKADIPTQYLFL